MHAETLPEHRWLQKLLGEWTYEHEPSGAPGEPEEKWTGSESVRSLGDVWVLAEGRVEMPGHGPGTTLITLGYDPDKQRFVGTFIGSMMTYLWVYEGELNAEGNKLTLRAEGPDCQTGEKIIQYRDVIEFLSDDHRTLSSYALGDDGQWTRFMTVHYRRRK